MGSRLDKNSAAVRARIAAHEFEDEEGEEYSESKFGGFPDYFRRKKIKLQNRDVLIREAAPDAPPIFRGVVAHVNGYTQPSLDDLHRLIVAHGGGFMQYLDGKTTVTHIIASNLTPKKAVEFKRYRIVKPAWIVDSIKEGKLLPWNDYRVVDEVAGQRVLAFGDNGKVTSKTNDRPRGYRDQTEKSWYTSQLKSSTPIQGPNETPNRPKFKITGAFEGPSPQEIKAVAERDEYFSDEESITSEDFAITSSLEAALKAVHSGSQGRRQLVLGSQSNDKEETAGKMNGQDGEERMKIHFEDDPNEPSKLGLETVSSVQRESEEPDITQTIPRPSKHALDTEGPSPKRTKGMTAEEHNASLLTDPHMRKSSTANPDFLKVYYAESRLHHLSTWKAELKARLQQMSAERLASQKRPGKRAPGSRRYILHVDFDSFFCAVSLLKAPEFKDKPAVVAHSNGPGSEIASCNYPARAFGIKNGQWMKSALETCPDLKVLPYDFPAYEKASQLFYEAILDVGGTVQSVSIDEALVDVTSLCVDIGGSNGIGLNEGSIWREQAKADEIATGIRQRVRETTSCEVSVGIGGNILLAKLALRKAKPAGQYQLKPEEVLDFIGDLTVQSLPGVSYNLGSKLEELGIVYVKDIRSLTKERLMTTMGPKTGEKLWDYSRGIDRAEVGDVVVRKSVSAEVNWGIRFISQAEAEEFVQNLCGELEKRLLEQRVRGRQLTMKIMHRSPDAPLDPPKHLGHGKCDTYNKSITLGVATNSASIIGKEAVSILRSFRFSPGELRGLGVQMTKLEPLKKTGNKALEDSQTRLAFASPAPKPLRTRSADEDDPICDPRTPKKDKTAQVHPAKVVATHEADKGATSKLNLMGTQFIIPTQMDEDVLQQLPTDIRSRLLAQGKAKKTDLITNSRAQSPASRPGSPSRKTDHGLLPSQFDPEVFDALPEDVKAEVLASVPSHLRAAGPSRGQSLLPQSPRKNRTINALAKKPVTPTKKKGVLARGRKGTVDSHFKQASFVSGGNQRPNTATGTEEEDEDLDPEFLAALPEDVRQEVIADHRRQKQSRRGQLGLQMPARRPATAQTAATEKRVVKIPPRPPKPHFTMQKLSTLPELRDAISAWFNAFKDEGPADEDTTALCRYLGRVVKEERDMAKAVSVVKWFAWVVENGNEELYEVDDSRDAWGMAVWDVKSAVQTAVRERGLGRVEF